MTQASVRPPPPLVSVVIPARNEGTRIGGLVAAAHAGAPTDIDLEVVVVDDGSQDATADAAGAAGAVVIRRPAADGGNPAAARNLGAAAARGDPIVFLDADCVPRAGWLAALLAAHERGADAAGGSFALPAALGWTARCDYFCCWYHVHPLRAGGPVRHHPPGNLSVRRAAFARTCGFFEHHPVAYAHEELDWQAELRAGGGTLVFVPEAIVEHHNRPGLGNLLRRSYRWGYSALESKSRSGVARFGGLYRHPLAVVALAPLLWPALAAHVLFCWARVGEWRPLAAAPVILAAQAAYAAGIAIGGTRWLRLRSTPPASYRPRWE